MINIAKNLFSKIIKRGSIEDMALRLIKSNYVQTTIFNKIINNNFVHASMTDQSSGNLIQYMRDRVNLTYIQKAKLAEEIILGMCDIHSNGFIHRDIKPDNILVDLYMNIKIIDFNASTKIDEPQSILPGSDVYSAPELRLGLSDSKCDTYSVGLVLYFLFYEKHPYDEMEIDQIMEAKRNGCFPTFPEGDSPEYECLIKWLCALNPDDRPSDSELTQLIGYNESSSMSPLDPTKDWSLILHIFDEDYIPYILDATVNPFVYFARAANSFSTMDKYGYRVDILSSALNGCEEAIKELGNLIYYLPIIPDIDNISFNLEKDFAFDKSYSWEEIQTQWNLDDIGSIMNIFLNKKDILIYIDPLKDDCISPIFLHSGFPFQTGTSVPMAIDIFDLMYPYYMSVNNSISGVWEMIAVSLMTGLYLEQDIERGLDILFQERYVIGNNIGMMIYRLCLTFGVFLAKDIQMAYQTGYVVDPLFMFLIISGYLDDIVGIRLNKKTTEIENELDKYLYIDKIFKQFHFRKFVSLDKWGFSIFDLINVIVSFDFYDPALYKMFYLTKCNPMRRLPPSTFDTVKINEDLETENEDSIQITITPFTWDISLKNAKKMDPEGKKYFEDVFHNLRSIYDDFYTNKMSVREYLSQEISFFYGVKFHTILLPENKNSFNALYIKSRTPKSNY